MELLLWLLLVFAVIIAIYYGVCHLIRLFTGCDFEEATVKIHNYFNGTTMYHFENDSGFSNAVWENVHNVIGDKSFERLSRLANTSIGVPFLWFNRNGELPTINICVFYKDENEQQLLKTVLTNLVRSYLKTYGYTAELLAEWKMCNNPQIPYLQIRYAKTKKERQILHAILMCEQQKIVSQNSTLIDEEDEEDLND